MRENWKLINFKLKFKTETVLDVSDTGLLKIYNKNAPKGKLLKGSMINGYKIARLSFFKTRYGQVTESLTSQRLKVAVASPGGDKDWEQRKLDKMVKEDLDSRRVRRAFLIHRLVAESFLVRPTADHTVVAHLDHDKLNNHKQNLRWQTVEQNYKHQATSPAVIAAKLQVRHSKLTETEVAYIKKLITEGKQSSKLAKAFKVSHTQIHRIKTGVNWGHVNGGL